VQLTGSQAGVVVAVLVAAVLHACWNALLKGDKDRLVMVVLLDLTALALSVPLVLLARRPAPASWWFLGLSVLLHGGYKVLLMQSYRVGDLNQVYPLAGAARRCWWPGSPAWSSGNAWVRGSWPGWSGSAAGWCCCWRRAGPARAVAR
jgi:hypothetical protein